MCMIEAIEKKKHKTLFLEIKHGFHNLKYIFGLYRLLSLVKIQVIIPSRLNVLMRMSCKEIERIPPKTIDDQDH